MEKKRRTLSVVINTLNEETNLPGCLENIRWADEIIVVDMHSDDRTVEIARQYTDKVFFFGRMGYVEPARNFAISQATGDWVLVLDADERITDALRDAVESIMHQDVAEAAYRTQISEYMFGKIARHGSWPLVKHARLFRRGKCRWLDTIHSTPVIDGPIGTIERGEIRHYSHLTIGHFLSKLNRYTDIEARQWYDEGVRKSLLNAIYYGLGKCLKEYIYYGGYKDGGHGLILAVLWGFYYFTARVKLWELWYKYDHDLPERPAGLDNLHDSGG